MMKLSIVHYLPLEDYPPVKNFVDYASAREGITISVFSSDNLSGRKEYEREGVSITRFRSPHSGMKRLVRLVTYWVFNLGTLFELIRRAPDTLMYYDTYGAWPCYIYKKFIKKSVKLYIHCHEYFSPECYASGMAVNRYYHRLEQDFLYSSAVWISQTNEHRMKLFMDDNPNVAAECTQIMPNYPSRSWICPVRPKRDDTIIRFVLVGAMSIEKSYIRELCEYLLTQDQFDWELDFYCYHNLTPATKAYLDGLESNKIRLFSEGVEYDQLSELLGRYDVGLILYKAHIPNYRYNAPNKLFEYLNSGLDVWFAEELEGCLSYVAEGVYPKVCSVDFANLSNDLVQHLLSKDGLNHAPMEFCCEDVYSALLGHMLI
jgi:hypothetical protein